MTATNSPTAEHSSTPVNGRRGYCGRTRKSLLGWRRAEAGDTTENTPDSLRQQGTFLSQVPHHKTGVEAPDSAANTRFRA